MRKLFLAGFAVLSASLLFAQQSNTSRPTPASQVSQKSESEYYYVNVPIVKVYPYRRGFVVEYQKTGYGGRGTVYLPLEWFHSNNEGEAPFKGELIALGTGSSWPSLTVYYKNKEFSHVRLYVRRDATHQSWGNIPQQVNIDDRFEGVESVKLEL
jgi:hypothetical protein